jgi:hypothetical protein
VERFTAMIDVKERADCVSDEKHTDSDGVRLTMRMTFSEGVSSCDDAC